jgi:hypothetical protein
MQILKELETAPLPIEEEEHRHTKRLLIGVLLALLLTGAILGGFFYLRQQHEARVANVVAAETKTKSVPPPQVEIFVDDAMPKDKQTLLSGTVHNISNAPLRQVSVRLELRRRTGNGLDSKILPLDPANLEPDGKARYSLSIAASEYSTARITGILAGSDHSEIPFKTVPGAQRPPEPPPTAKTIIVNPPRRRGQGEEFINTPDNPGRIR